MTRTILDRDLRTWEVYATAGDFGLSNPAKVAFRCTSDPGQRPREMVHHGSRADAERRVLESHESELEAMLKGAIAIR